MKISQKHPNRKAHNWLLYDIGDRYRQEYTKYYKGTLVDLGCGEAPYKDFFLQYCEQYIGVDWEGSYHKTKVDIFSDLNKKINIEDEFADTIISLSVMEHLYNPQKFLKESYRILKKDGVMILGVPWMYQIHEAPYDYFRYTTYGLRYLFEQAGFKEIHIQPTSSVFTTIVIKLNNFSLRFIKGSKIRQIITKMLLLPFWYLGQKTAPILDNMHRGWSLETQSYYVIAKK